MYDLLSRVTSIAFIESREETTAANFLVRNVTSRPFNSCFLHTGTIRPFPSWSSAAFKLPGANYNLIIL